VFDRFTRDEVSQWVWWPAAMLLVVLFVLTFPGQNRAIVERRDEAAARAWSLATGTLAPALGGVSAEPITGPPSERLAQLMAADTIEPPWTETLRIWADDSTLLWSSDAEDPVGSAGGLNDEEIIRALADLTRADQVVRDRDLDGRPSEPTFSAYAPFTLGGEIAAAEFEVSEGTLLGDVKADWLGYRIILGLAGGLVLAFAIGSMREPIARIGAGVPFFRSSLPSGSEVIDSDEKLELERAGIVARERVANMELRLQESEQQRLRAEGDLQRTLSQLASRTDHPTRSVIPRPAPTAEPPATTTPPASPPRITLVPDVPEAPAPSRVPAAAAPAGPIASGTAQPTAAPSAAPGVAEAPAIGSAAAPTEPATRARRREPAKHGRGRFTATTSEPTSRRSDAARRGDDLVVVRDASPQAPAEPRLDPAGGRDRTADAPTEVAPSAPEPLVVPASAGIEGDDADARDVLERLVEPVAASVAPPADAGALRAALARTAARKKPGSRHDERLAEDAPDR
jgi:hypothetical protein